jgi:hypothetical protein
MPHAPRNPADLLGIGSDPALCRLLRACGVEEARITGGASDYDKFLALAAALTLCEGHPLRDEVNAALTRATGLTAPLCPHTARAHWDTWVEMNHYGRQAIDTALPAVCPLCVSAAPHVIHGEDCTDLPNPLAIQAPDLTAWSTALEVALPTDGSPALFTLPEGYTFTRPNPYHAGLAVGKTASGEALTAKERDLLIAQALRVWGLAWVGKDTSFLLQGGTPEAVTALLAYLDASKALPRIVWLPDDPAQAEAVSGLYPEVGTGYTVAKGEPLEVTESRKAAYAKAAPIGRATLLIP